jgi:type IX secretion system substrate protein
MKKQLLILSAVILAFTSQVAHAQQDTVFNPGFEVWSNDPIASGAMNPNGGNGKTGWWDYNFFNYSLLGSSPIAVTQCSDTVHGGKYSARIESVVYTPTSYTYLKPYGVKDTNGILVTGNVTITTGVTFKTGIPFTSKLTNFSFYYQYQPNGVDSAVCSIAVYKWNGTTRVLKGGGQLKINASTAGKGWQQANVAVYDTATPDTVLIEFSSSSLLSKPKPGSLLYVDDAAVTLITGVTEPFVIGSGIQVYPNPASNSIKFNITGMNNVATVSIFDMTGQKINSTEVHNGLTTVNTQTLSNGIYFYQVYDNSGSIVKSGKFSVVK